MHVHKFTYLFERKRETFPLPNSQLQQHILAAPLSTPHQAVPVSRPPSNPRPRTPDLEPQPPSGVRLVTPETTPPQGTFPHSFHPWPQNNGEAHKKRTAILKLPIPSSAAPPTPLDVEHPSYKQHLPVSPSRPLISHSLRVAIQVYGMYCPSVSQSSIHATTHDWGRGSSPGHASAVTERELP